MATPSGTWAYRDRFGDAYGRTFFRRFGDCVVSSVGAGTYLGDPTDAVDDRYRAALVQAFDNGCNVVDTAINYRCQRAERVVGGALDASGIDRESLLVATKGGFLPFDGSRPADPSAYVTREFLDAGLVDLDDLARGSHCIAPGFLSWSLDRSLDNLGVEAVDLYYVHNPETQLRARSREAVYDALEDAFRLLERRRAAGDLRHYGVTSWEAFRVDEGDDAYLSLPEIHARARAAAAAEGADDCGFAAVQLPFNVLWADAVRTAAQPHERDGEGESDGDGGRLSALRWIQERGLSAFASAPLAQGELAAPGGIPTEIDDLLSGDTPAQRAINFARSAPGVTCALVGTGRPSHAAENLAAGTFDPLGARAFDDVFA